MFDTFAKAPQKIAHDPGSAAGPTKGSMITNCLCTVFCVFVWLVGCFFVCVFVRLVCFGWFVGLFCCLFVRLFCFVLIGLGGVFCFAVFVFVCLVGCFFACVFVRLVWFGLA